MFDRRIRERDLIEPVLRLILTHSDVSGGLEVTRIQNLLRERMTLSVEDRKILKGRKDDRFSQVVRNLVSHRTLEKGGLAEYRNTGEHKRGAYYLTPKGIFRLKQIDTEDQPDLFNRGDKL